MYVHQHLLQLAFIGLDRRQFRRVIEMERDLLSDQTIEQMDRIWEEEAVSFLGNPAAGCAGRSSTEQPLRPMQRPLQ